MGIHGFLIEERESERNLVDENLKRIGMSRNTKTDSEILILLVNEIEKLRDNRKSLSITYVKLLSSYFEILDDHIPDWKVFCKKEIDQIVKLIEH
ncbi:MULTISPECIES: hypothetical protein [Paenibacillus]|uniref:Uncharacterized protein n=2 Tax=Paenibacillus TaxID=44249 RepID=A0ABX2ZDA3_PAEPO|nr:MULTISPECIES: hypothetical protein [Paenibacillus]MDR6779518.1 hypothetical protein [Paenibacillus peoriae]ODA09108.1 hypothetical protein A7312_27200 [Paenibacillus polymyxa]